MNLTKQFFITLILPLIMSISYAQEELDIDYLPPPFHTKFYGYLKVGLQNYTYHEPNVMSIKGPMQIINTMFGLKLTSFIATDIEIYYAMDTGKNIYDGALVRIFSDGREETIPIRSHSNDYYYGGTYRIGFTPLGNDSQNNLLVYLGISYRYLDNLIRGEGAYRREQTYLYTPLGIRAQVKIKKFIGLRGNLEFRPLLLGWNKSHFSMLGRDNDLTFKQRNGLGTEASMGIDFFIAKDSSIFVETFIDYWNIAQSTRTDSYIAGRFAGTYIEPKNTTLAYGIRIGYSF